MPAALSRVAKLHLIILLLLLLFTDHHRLNRHHAFTDLTLHASKVAHARLLFSTAPVVELHKVQVLVHLLTKQGGIVALASITILIIIIVLQITLLGDAEDQYTVVPVRDEVVRVHVRVARGAEHRRVGGAVHRARGRPARIRVPQHLASSSSSSSETVHNFSGLGLASLREEL